MGLWSKKTLAQLQGEADGSESQGQLKRALSASNLVFLGIGAIIGAGIFVMSGQAAARFAGPAVVFSYVLAGLGCGFAGLCYAEFASMIPIAGSAYTYSYATLGELLAWIIGWDLIIEYLFAASTVAVGWSGYFCDFLRVNLGVTIPESLTNAPFKADGMQMVRTGAIVNLPAVLLVVFLTLLLVRGIKESARFNGFIVLIKVAIVLLVIGFGLAHVTPDNWKPFIPENTGVTGHFGWSGIARGAAYVFFAYIGFDAVSTAAQEAKNPQRDLPIGILGSLGVCTLLYILMSLVLTGVAHFTTLDVDHPVAKAIEAVPALGWLGWFVKLGAIAGLASVVLVMLLGQPRIFFAMSRDGLLPPAFGKIHPRFQTPAFATVLTGSIAAILAGLFPLEILGELVNIGTLLAFVLVCAGVMVLRVRQPSLPRPFRTPLVPLVPILGIVFCGGLMATLPWETWVRLLAWLGIGLLIYFGYGRRHSRVGNATRSSA